MGVAEKEKSNDELNEEYMWSNGYGTNEKVRRRTGVTRVGWPSKAECWSGMDIKRE